MDISKLRKLQNDFEISRASTPEAQQLYKQSDELVLQFQQKFSREKLRSMTLQEYVVGLQSKDSFCYWLEQKTKPVGRLLAGGAGYSFNVYYRKRDSTYVIQEGNKGKRVSEDEASKQLEILKAGIIELLNFAERKDFEGLRRISKQLPLDQHTIGKILSLYFPDKYLSLFSIRQMNEFLDTFGLLDAKTEESDAFEKREILLAFKEKDDIMKKWSNRKYVDFLFNKIRKKEPEPEKLQLVFWKFSPGNRASLWEPFKDSNIIAMGSWGIPGLNLSKWDTKNALLTANSNLSHRAAQELWTFKEEVKQGDIVVAYGRKSIYDFGVVYGDYQFDDEEDVTWWGYEKLQGKQQWRTVKWVQAFDMPVDISKDSDLYSDLSKTGTIHKISTELTDKLLSLLGEKAAEIQRLSVEAAGRAETSYFILRTGGGEYSDQQEQKYNFKEGIPEYKQLTAAENSAKFVYLENGFFYGKGKIGNITGYEKDGTKYFDAQIQNYERTEPVPLKDIGDKLSISLSQAGIMKITEEDYKTITEFGVVPASLYTIDDFSTETGFEKATIERWEKLLLRKKQIIFQGPPGTGKTFVAQRLAKLVAQTNGLVETVQFHPDYSYEDFIQGYFPEPGNTILQFNMKKGRFLDFCERAKNKPKDTPCVMIIDEINRAKLARVFGELMYLLEYRDKEIPLAAGGKPYRIPENVHLIGTMNTADRSIALVDHALRRRFSFIRLQPEYNILTSYLKKYNLPADSLVTVLQQVNRAINDLNYEVGISFFMKDQAQLKQWLPDIWKTEIEPYLEEYFYDQKSKVEAFRWEKLAENSLKEWTM
jgi:hypothetical protein